MTPTRWKILRQFLAGRRNGASWGDMAAVFFARSYAGKARNLVERTEDAGDFLVVQLRDLPWPVYWPKRFPRRSLEEVIVEIFSEQNWHHYFLNNHRVSAGDTVIDCGAAEGLFSLLCAARGAVVQAIEPLPEFQRSLARTFGSIPAVTVLPFALSGAPGRGFIRSAGICSSLSGSEDGIPVRIETLDRLFDGPGPPIRFIKIDLEGSDVEALQGAEGIINRDAPRISITTYHHPAHARQIEAFLGKCRPRYRTVTRGIYQEHGGPIMLYAWPE
jgi:FkbM family methyltransferase